MGIHSIPAHFLPVPIPDRIFGSEPERGDIVVFRHPVNNSDFIKRVVGMPGDRIQVKNAVLHINDTPVGIEAAGEFVEVFEAQGPQKRLPACKGSVGLGADCIKDKYIETLPEGSSHSILDVRVSSADNTPVYTVPEGNYFFMGDNRDNSSDSRFSAVTWGRWFCTCQVSHRSRRPRYLQLTRSLYVVLLDMARGPFL
jgi:signal peptidase I